MIRMIPVEEPEVLDSLVQGRFSGDVRGYVILDGPEYRGHCLFAVEPGCTRVLEVRVSDPSLLDGAVRAAVAAGENAGASVFALADQPELLRWREAWFRGCPDPIPNDRLFHFCG